MAADPSAAERAYGEIKRKLLAGEFYLRQRLDATALADELAVSTTPVREALVRLAAERLIVSRPAHGYLVALWSQEQLGQLYAWRADLAELASASYGQRALAPVGRDLDYAQRTAMLLQSLGAQANAELAHAAANADERLHHARRAERDLWSDAEEDLLRLEQALQESHPRRRSALRAYHQRRLKAVRQIRERALLLAMGPNGV